MFGQLCFLGRPAQLFHNSFAVEPFHKHFCRSRSPIPPGDALLLPENRSNLQSCMPLLNLRVGLRQQCFGRVYEILCAQGAPKFRKFYNSFAGFSHKFCVISTPHACFFGSERTMHPVESFSDVIRFVQRMLDEKNEFCARGAPKFRKSCNSFLKFLRGFRVISTPDAHFFGSEQTSDFTESCTENTRFLQRTLAECTQLFLRAACRNSGNFAILSRNFCAIFA